MINNQSWQQALTDLVTDPLELLSLLQLDPDLCSPEALHLFPLKVPREFVNRMEKGNPRDPLLLQVLPLHQELTAVKGYTRDPLHERHFNPVKGLLHKYAGRVLVTLTSTCAIHCRYCFRRFFPYEANNPGTSEWENIFQYISRDQNINEVILSGGDPLSVSDKRLKNFTDQLSLIPHVKKLRFHTRMPVVLPGRMTDEFLHYLANINLKVIMVIHANHPKEINQEVKQALQRLRTRVTVFNQSVLLKGINDEAETLINLSEKLFEADVIPYYLHVLDKTEGTAHFDLARKKAKELHLAMRKKLPGYLVPRLVCEEAGQPFKVLV